DFQFVAWVPLSGQIMSNFGPLPRTPRANIRSIDRWGQNYYQDAIGPPGGGAYTVYVPSGTTSFYSFRNLAHYVSPAARDVPVLAGGSSGIDFNYHALAIVSGVLTDSSNHAVGNGCYYDPTLGWQCNNNLYVNVKGIDPNAQ